METLKKISFRSPDICQGVVKFHLKNHCILPFLVPRSIKKKKKKIQVGHCLPAALGIEFMNKLNSLRISFRCSSGSQIDNLTNFPIFCKKPQIGQLSIWNPSEHLTRHCRETKWNLI